MYPLAVCASAEYAEVVCLVSMQNVFDCILCKCMMASPRLCIEMRQQLRIEHTTLTTIQIVDFRQHSCSRLTWRSGHTASHVTCGS